MQIQCVSCRSLMAINPQGGHFVCPTCHVVNVVGAPVFPGYPPHGYPPQYPAAPPRPKQDHRGALVLLAFVVLGTAGLLLPWWGIALGVALLGWAVVAAMGKVKGPMSMVFHGSTKTTALAALSLALGALVMTCSVMGAVAESRRSEREARAIQEKAERDAKEKAEREQREAEATAARAVREAELRNKAVIAAASYAAGLNEVETLIAGSKWLDAEAKLEEVTRAVAEYKALMPVPDEIAALLPREATVAPKIDAKRREREATAWISRAQAVVSDKGKCETQGEVETALVQVEGLQPTDPGHATIKELNAQLRACLENMPPPSAWRYDLRRDPMGGAVATAVTESSNTFEFDFPYQGTQRASLMVRNDSGLDVMLSIEQGQFMCTLGCSVLVRFDDGEAIRWRATGTADHSTTTVFMRRASDFVKALSKSRVVRIEATFYQEGSRVLEFPVARFDVSRLQK